MTLDLTLACSEYAWTEPLHDGRVSPQGVDLTTVDFPNPDRFSRMVHDLAFDVCELSMGTYLATRRDPAAFPFTALPVFPYRRFRHSFVYRRAGGPVAGPPDLEGARVGLINWQTTTGIWQRGVLAERHGVDLEAIEWVAGGAEIVDVDTGGFDVRYRDRRSDSAMPLLEGLLAAGDLDALCVPVHPETDAAERLFDDPVAVERTYARETGHFPIMHTVVVRDALLEREPWLAQALVDAFADARRQGLATLDRPRWLPLASVRPLVDRQRALLGADPWAGGLGEDNRATLETLVGYAADQGVAAERDDVEDLFATRHLDPGWFERAEPAPGVTGR
ncbi:MAG: 4,5-dihydroxyphthalate decarboxylase [Halobacteriaceae archaeon]